MEFSCQTSPLLFLCGYETSSECLELLLAEAQSLFLFGERLLGFSLLSKIRDKGHSKQPGAGLNITEANLCRKFTAVFTLADYGQPLTHEADFRRLEVVGPIGRVHVTKLFR